MDEWMSVVHFDLFTLSLDRYNVVTKSSMNFFISDAPDSVSRPPQIVLLLSLADC